MGTGKSYSNVENAKVNNQLYFSVVALTSTQESHYTSFNRAGIKSFSYKDIKDLNKDFKKFNDDTDYKYVDEDEDDDNDKEKYIKKAKTDDLLTNACIFTTIDSLLLFKDKDIDFSRYIVYLDEIHSLFLYLLRCDNLSKKRIDICAFLVKILKTCKQIIMVDGDICNNAITLIELLERKPYQFIENSYQSYKDVKCYKINDMNEIIKLFKQDIENKEYFICCCNTKTQTDQIEQILLSLKVESS